MSFGSLLFTTKGRSLQSKAIAGAELLFTRIAMGSGNLGTSSQLTLTALINEQVTMNIDSITAKDGYATIRSNFSNADIISGFYWREVGIFANDPDIGEVLYCYANAGSLAEYIPLQESEIVEKVISLSVIVGDATSITAVLDDSIIFMKAIETLEQEPIISDTDQIPFYKISSSSAKKITWSNILNTIKNFLSGVFAPLIYGLSMVRSGLDSNGKYTTVTYRRSDGTLAVTSVLSGGTSPEYTTRTETYYDTDGTTVLQTIVYTITYTDGDATSEVIT